ncbi:MAG: PIN domain-containing protein [Candidatus Sungbacteria bacterium]|nr:PIN domain-containing protein [Candidatus Sungbacteria bacterium]
MVYLVDSSVWAALFLDFDTRHRKAEKIIQKLSGTIYVPYCVLMEVVAILAYKHSKALADNFIAYVRDNRDLKIINDDAFEEINFYTTIPHQLSFVDVALIFLSGKLTAKIITLNKQLERIVKKYNP